MHGGELTELMIASDAALYAAKNSGRNRVLLAGDPGRKVESEDVSLGD